MKKIFIVFALFSIVTTLKCDEIKTLQEEISKLENKRAKKHEIIYDINTKAEKFHEQHVKMLRALLDQYEKVANNNSDERKKIIIQWEMRTQQKELYDTAINRELKAAQQNINKNTKTMQKILHLKIKLLPSLMVEKLEAGKNKLQDELRKAKEALSKPIKNAAAEFNKNCQEQVRTFLNHQEKGCKKDCPDCKKTVATWKITKQHNNMYNQLIQEELKLAELKFINNSKSLTKEFIELQEYLAIAMSEQNQNKDNEQ